MKLKSFAKWYQRLLARKTERLARESDQIARRTRPGRFELEGFEPRVMLAADLVLDLNNSGGILTSGAETVFLEHGSNAGQLQLRTAGGAVHTFTAPSESLTIRLGDGDD